MTRNMTRNMTSVVQVRMKEILLNRLINCKKEYMRLVDQTPFVAPLRLAMCWLMP